MEGRPECHVDELYSAVKAKQLSLGIPSTSSSIDLTNTLRERGLIPELRPYQLDALNWMLSREQNSNSTETGIGKHVLGGILADEMGLGKTVEVLALILANPHPCTLAQLNTPSLATNQDISTLNGRKSWKNSKTKKTLETFGVKTKANELPSTETEILPSAQVLEQKVPNDPPKQARKRVRPTGCEVLGNTCNKCGKLKADSSSPPKRGRTTTNLDKTIEEVIQSNTASDQYCQCTSKVSETRQRAQKLYTDALAPFQSSNYASKSSSLTKERTNTIQTRCTCGGVNAPPEAPIECTDCHTWQHPSCVNIDVSEISGSPYFCSLCTCKRDPVISGTTLIITPSTISYQWISEIRRHVSSLCKILVYKGVKAHGYIRPCDLARFDVIITTYQVLRSELHFADVALNEPPRLRRASTFMNTPSPLVSINWWRICLDEAQMVEGTSTQAAKMALRLTTELRWCVTGTPVQKSTADLFGLFTFLQLEPYDQFRVFRNAFLTGQNEERLDALARVLAHVMWRSSKKDVIHQIRLPEQSQKTHWLKFSPIEDHFYKQQHAACTRDALARFSSFGRLNLRLSDIDRETVTKLLNPLLRLRQACCHPQMVKGQFVSLNRAALTMEQLLEALIKKAFVDCEDTHRLWVAAVNGMAAVYILQEKFPDAVEMYRTVLRKNEELKGTVKTDTLQLLHATYNLAQVLDIKEASIPPTLRDSKLNEEVDQLKDHYLNPFATNIVKAEEKLNPIVSKVIEFEEQLKTFGEPWWTALLTRVQGTSLDARCVQEVQEKLAEGDGQDRIERVHNRFNSISGLMYLLSSRLDEITENREEVTNAIKDLKICTLDVLATEASYCHLRPEASQIHKKCPLCVAHDQIEDYETLLFHMAGRKEVDDKEGANALMDELRKGTWADGETERILKCMLWFARRIDCPPNMIESGSVHLKLFDTLKKEFRLVRVFWRRLSDQAAAVDELNMAKLRLRVRLPGEKKPNKDLSNADKRVASELETGFKETYENIYIIEPHEVNTHLAKLKLDETVASHEFERKKGRLLYLQNLEKAGYGKKGSSNPEECPICKLTLGNKWSVLQCGHSFCMDCVQHLAMGGVAKKLNCAVCRQITAAGDVSYVDTCPPEETDQEVVVKGSLSTKVDAVIHRLLLIRKNEPEAKALVFSTWPDVLKAIGRACDDNGIRYCDLMGSKFQENLAKFKESVEIQVLLMPLKSGANGLNLVEATHVLLVEPILNPGSELQAIGRVHRIGQTKPTQVHRFLVKSTIEEGLASLMQRHVTDASETLVAKENPVTLCELRDLFLDQTCMSTETATVEEMR